MERQVEELIVGRNEGIFSIVLIYIVYYLFTRFSRADIFVPLENQVKKTSRSLVYAFCYEIAKNLRFAIVHPFNWRIVNHNNKIVFLLPELTSGYGCSLGTTPGAVFKSYHQQNLNINCFGVSAKILEDLTTILPFEKINLRVSSDGTNLQDITAIEVINALLKEGFFTLDAMQ